MDLTHHFLLSMPTLANSWFDKSITYIFEHSDTGAVGFVINRHTQMVSGDIYDQLKIDCNDKIRRSVPVFQGGPVDEERGFILCADNPIPNSTQHSTEKPDKAFNKDPADNDHDDLEQANADSYNSNEFGIGISSSIVHLANLGRGQGPTSHLLLLGYAGWAAGQLESEIASNSWLTCKATEEIIFHEDCEQKFNMAAKSIGIDFSLMSGDVGHA